MTSTRRVCRLAILTTFTATCTGAATMGHAAADDDTVTPSITGRAGTQVRGQCLVLVETPEGEQRPDLNEAVPVGWRWRSDWPRCELETRGPVTVEVTGKGTDGRTSASEGRVIILLG